MFYISKWTFQISEETRDNKIQRIECMTLGFLCWLFDIFSIKVFIHVYKEKIDQISLKTFSFL